MKSFTRFSTAAALALGLATVGACRDGAVEPTAAGKPSLGLVTVRWVGDTAYSTFTYDPGKPDSYMLVDAVHRIRFSEYSVCDPATSSYGVGEWDKPCQPLTTPIVITAKSYKNAAGREQIVFDQHLRFVPQTEADKGVFLSMRDKAAAVAGLYNIQWCPNGYELKCVDEYAQGDASLVTKSNNTSGFLTRRIKHFSGYNVALGYTQPNFDGSDSTSTP